MKRLKLLLRPAAITVGGLVVAVLLGFVSRSSDRTPVKELDVTVETPEGVHFIDESTVRAEVLAKVDGLIGGEVGEMDLVAIEKDLRNIGCVAKADVYHTVDGTMHVTVKQREPIVRVINADGSGFYIDREGWTMPLSATYTARVLVVTGQLIEPFVQRVVDLHAESDSLKSATCSDELYEVARTISADPLWNALFDQAVVDATGQIELIPRVGGNRVKVGNGEHLAQRLEKLRTFYQQGMPQAEWRKYSVIDTRFADQVVCTKRPAQPAGTGVTSNNMQHATR